MTWSQCGHQQWGMGAGAYAAWDGAGPKSGSPLSPTSTAQMQVGDRLDTDIMFGKNGGLATTLVLSGEQPQPGRLVQPGSDEGGAILRTCRVAQHRWQRRAQQLPA